MLAPMSCSMAVRELSSWLALLHVSDASALQHAQPEPKPHTHNKWCVCTAHPSYSRPTASETPSNIVTLGNHK